jgi:hypothetical protein
MKFPKTLYVKMEKDGDITYPMPAEHLIDIAKMGETIRVGIYELRETTYAECQVTCAKSVRRKAGRSKSA